MDSLWLTVKQGEGNKSMVLKRRQLKKNGSASHTTLPVARPVVKETPAQLLKDEHALFHWLVRRLLMALCMSKSQLANPWLHSRSLWTRLLTLWTTLPPSGPTKRVSRAGWALSAVAHFGCQKTSWFYSWTLWITTLTLRVRHRPSGSAPVDPQGQRVRGGSNIMLIDLVEFSSCIRPIPD